MWPSFEVYSNWLRVTKLNGPNYRQKQKQGLHGQNIYTYSPVHSFHVIKQSFRAPIITVWLLLTWPNKVQYNALLQYLTRPSLLLIATSCIQSYIWPVWDFSHPCFSSPLATLLSKQGHLYEHRSKKKQSWRSTTSRFFVELLHDRVGGIGLVLVELSSPKQLNRVVTRIRGLSSY